MSALHPVPHQTPMLDANGLLTPVWADWFNKLFTRVGGTIAEANSSLTSLALATPDNSTLELSGTTLRAKDSGITNAKLAGSIAFAKLLSTDWAVDGLTLFGVEGYQRIGTGLYIQWGRKTGVTSGSSSTVTFPIAFTTACLQMLACPRDNSGVATTATGQVGTGNYSASTASIYNRTSVTHDINWIAVGY